MKHFCGKNRIGCGWKCWDYLLVVGFVAGISGLFVTFYTCYQPVWEAKNTKNSLCKIENIDFNGKMTFRECRGWLAAKYDKKYLSLKDEAAYAEAEAESEPESEPEMEPEPEAEKGMMGWAKPDMSQYNKAKGEYPCVRVFVTANVSNGFAGDEFVTVRSLKNVVLHRDFDQMEELPQCSYDKCDPYGRKSYKKRVMKFMQKMYKQKADRKNEWMECKVHPGKPGHAVRHPHHLGTMAVIHALAWPPMFALFCLIVLWVRRCCYACRPLDNCKYRGNMGSECRGRQAGYVIEDDTTSTTKSIATQPPPYDVDEKKIPL